MIFYDTGAWYALTVPGDRNASAARGLQEDVARGVHGSIVTTNFVLNEAATLVRMETDTDTAVRLARGLLSRPTITLVRIGPDHFEGALALFERHRDKRWSFTDCTSFAIMHELGITRAFSFDRNFEQAGFERLP